MDKITLTHWSGGPLGPLNSIKPRQGETRRLAMFAKPHGLWLSDETDFGWREWCMGEQFNTSGFTHRVDFEVDMTDVLHLATPQAILDFHAEFSVEGTIPDMDYRTIDWAAVAERYKGILITPYQWSMRFDINAQWYYGWDCASGCFWDVSCLTRLKETRHMITGANCLKYHSLKRWVDKMEEDGPEPPYDGTASAIKECEKRHAIKVRALRQKVLEIGNASQA